MKDEKEIFLAYEKVRKSSIYKNVRKKFMDCGFTEAEYAFVTKNYLDLRKKYEEE